MRRGLIGSAIAAALVVAVIGGLAATTGIGDLEVFTPERGTVSQRLTQVEDYLVDNSAAVKTELARMQEEIDALAIAAVANGAASQPLSPAPEASIAFSGNGGAISEVFQRGAGRHEIALAIDGNDRRFAPDDWQFELFRHLGNELVLEGSGRGAADQWRGEVLITDASWDLWFQLDVGDDASWRVTLKRIGDAPMPTPQTTTAPQQTPTSAVATPTPQPPPESVTVKELVTAWKNNSIAADRKYKGRTINVDGYLESIDTVFGVTTVSLGTGEQFSIWTVNCTMMDGQRDELAKINKGDRIIVRGRITGEVFLSVGAEDCVLRATPSATATPTPASSPTPAIDLATTEVANVWVSVTNSRPTRLEVQVLIAEVSAVVDRYDLDVNLFAGRRHLGELCNTSKVYGDEWSANLGCSREDATHTEVTHANVSVGPMEFRCERNTVNSTSSETVLACVPRP